MRHAISLALELTNKYAGEVYISESGHLEFAFSASAGPAIHKAFGTPLGEAFGFMAGSPAAIGLVMADNAVKSAAVSITQYMTPNIGTSHSNEVIIAISGDASAVKAAVLEAVRQVLSFSSVWEPIRRSRVRRICKIPYHRKQRNFHTSYFPDVFHRNISVSRKTALQDLPVIMQRCAYLLLIFPDSLPDQPT